MWGKKIFLISAVLFISALIVLLSVEDNDFKFFAKLGLFVSVIVCVTVIITQKIGLSKSKALLANILLLFVSIIIVVVIAEVFVRYLFADITSTGDSTSYMALRWKEQNKPSINSFGFREREISRKKPFGVYRIAVVGDSITYGQGIKKEERFTNILEQELNSVKGNYEVYNFGKPGAETIDQIQFLDAVFEINPDFVLLQWFTNDVEGHDKSARPAPFRLIPSDSLSRYFHRNSALYYLINNQWIALQAQFGLIDSYKASMHARFKDIEGIASKRANQELIEFFSRVKDRNIPLGIILFHNIDVIEGDVGNYSYGYLLDRVINLSDKNDLRYVDMRQSFSQVDAKKLWVNRFDHHPNALANKMVADAILQAFDFEDYDN